MMYFHLTCKDLTLLKEGILINHLALPLLNLPENSTLKLEAVGFSGQYIKVLSDDDWIQYRASSTSAFTRINLTDRNVTDIQVLWKNISKLLPTAIRARVKFSQTADRGLVQLKIQGTLELEMSTKLQNLFGLPNQTYSGTAHGIVPPDIGHDKHFMFVTCSLVNEQYFSDFEMSPIIGAVPVDLSEGYQIHEFQNQPTFLLNTREIRSITLAFL